MRALARGQFEMAHCQDPFVHLREDVSRGVVEIRVDACVHVCTHVCVRARLCAASFSSPSSPVMERLFHCGRHRENEVSGRDRAEDPYNLTHRMSENIAQSKELSRVRAGATSRM